MNNSINNHHHNTALEYANAGFAVLPIHTPRFHENRAIGCSCQSGGCPERSWGKHPRVKGGCHAATTKESMIREWWSKWPDANVGVATGYISDLTVLDVDPRNGGDVSLRLLQDHGWKDNPATVTHLTGGGGHHYLFRRPKDGLPSKYLGQDYHGLDIKDDGGYIVAPPSVHKSGKLYQPIAGHAFDEIHIAPFPEYLIKLLSDTGKRSIQSRTNTVSSESRLLERRDDPTTIKRARAYLKSTSPAISGQGGNNATYKIACILIHNFWLEEDIAFDLFEEWNKRCEPPWDESDLIEFIEHALLYAKGEPGSLAKKIPAEWRTEILVPGCHYIVDQDNDSITKQEIRTIDFADNVIQAFPKDERYRRGGVIGDLREGLFCPISPPEVVLKIDTWCALYKFSIAKSNKDKKPSQKKTWADTSEKHAKLIIARAKTSFQVRDIKAITSYPVYAGSNFERSSPGWNANTGIFYYEPDDLIDLCFLDNVSQKTVHDTLDDLLVDFPFQSEAARQNFIGLMITPFLYPAIEGLAPWFVIDSSIRGSGKGLLIADVFGRIVTGKRLVSSSLLPDLAEFRKQLTTVLMTGRQILFFDNINHHVDNGIFARFLTEPKWSDRILNYNSNFECENKILTIGTANNFSCSDEIARRVVPIRLEPQTEHPELRSDFKHPDIISYLNIIRKKTINTILNMITTWIKCGCPKANITLGSFENWTQTIGGLLLHFGFNEFLTDRIEWANYASSFDEENIHLFIQAWKSKYGLDKKVTSKDLLPLIKVSYAFQDILSEPEYNRTKILGKRLHKYQGRVVGDCVIRGKRFSGRAKWWLEPAIKQNPFNHSDRIQTDENVKTQLRKSGAVRRSVGDERSENNSNKSIQIDNTASTAPHCIATAPTENDHISSKSHEKDTSSNLLINKGPLSIHDASEDRYETDHNRSKGAVGAVFSSLTKINQKTTQKTQNSNSRQDDALTAPTAPTSDKNTLINKMTASINRGSSSSSKTIKKDQNQRPGIFNLPSPEIIKRFDNLRHRYNDLCLDVDFREAFDSLTGCLPGTRQISKGQIDSFEKYVDELEYKK